MHRLCSWGVILRFLAFLCGVFSGPAEEVEEKQDDGSTNGTLLTPYRRPEVEGLHWVETFDGDVWKRWTPSGKEKYTGRWAVEGRKQEALVGDLGLHCPEPAMHYAVSADIPRVQLRLGGPPFLIQFEARHQDGLQCGGSYLKLFSRNGSKSEDFDGDTPYTIMFGPDRCGATDKVHFILRHRSPVTGVWEEKHLRDAPAVPNNKRTHLYGLLLRPDNSFEVQVDGEVRVSGSLLEAMKPPVNPPKEVDDPTDSKPSDWVEMRLIDDPEAKKPADWGDEDEKEFVLDLTARKPEGWNEEAPFQILAEKPADWDDAEDGEWEPTMVDNPACKVGCGKWEPPMMENPKYVGTWEPPLIDNPEYKGEWSPRQMANPEYFFDEHPAFFPAIDAIGFDLWTMQGGLHFDNIVIVMGNTSLAEEFANKSWRLRKAIEEVQDPPEKEPEPRTSWEETFQRLVDRNPIAAAVVCWSVLLIFMFQSCCPGFCPRLCRRCRGQSDGPTEPAEDEADDSKAEQDKKDD